MAMSKPSQVQLQFPKTRKCGLCDNIDVNWFCKDCVKNICDDCKKIHRKIPSCETHELELTEQLLDSSFLCEDHKDFTKFICKTCNLLAICHKCVGDQHAKHDIGKLIESPERLRERLEFLQQYSSSSIATIKCTQSKIKSQKVTFVTDAENTIREISTRSSDIQTLEKKLRQKVECEKVHGELEFDETCASLESKASALEEICQQYKGSLDIESEKKLGDIVLEMEEGITKADIPMHVYLPQASRLTPVLSKEELSKSFGSLKTPCKLRLSNAGHDSDSGVLREKIDKIAEFRISFFNGCAVSDICITKKGTDVWIVGKKLPGLRLIDKTGQVRKGVFMDPSPLYSAVTKDGDLFVSYGVDQRHKEKQKIIEKVSGRYGDASTFAEIKKCEAVLGLVAMEEGGVVCIVIDKKEKVGHRLVRIDENGKIVWDFVVGKLDVYTASVRQGKNGHFYLNSGSEIISILDDGGVLSVERAAIEKTVYADGPLICDSYGNIIIGSQSGLYVFRKDGKCVKSYERVNSWNGSITSLALDKDGLLWAGTNASTIYIFKYID